MRQYAVIAPLAELPEHFDVHSNQIQNWKKKLLAGAEDIFSQGAAEAEHNERETQKPHAKIRQLTMANDFLSKALDRDR